MATCCHGNHLPAASSHSGHHTVAALGRQINNGREDDFFVSVFDFVSQHVKQRPATFPSSRVVPKHKIVVKSLHGLGFIPQLHHSSLLCIQVDSVTMKTYLKDSGFILVMAKTGLSSDGGNPRRRALLKSNQLLFGTKPVCSGQFDGNPFILYSERQT